MLFVNKITQAQDAEEKRIRGYHLIVDHRQYFGYIRTFETQFVSMSEETGGEELADRITESKLF